MYMYLSSFFFALMGTTVKILVARLPSDEVALFRSLLPMVVLTPWLWSDARRQGRAFLKEFPLLALRGLLGGTALILYFRSIALIDFSNAVNELTAEAVAADVAKVKALGLPHKDTTDDDLPMSSRLYLAIKSFFENENLDALTIREWPEMPNVFGQWPYFAVARLADEGRAIGIEGDADGALGAWLVESLGLGRCYLSDWLEHDDKTITLWHGGAAPMSLCEPVGKPGGPQIAKHFNIKKPAVMEATLRAGMPVTIYRFWRCDGKYFLTAREGETLKPKRHLMATNGLAKMNCDPREWFEELCHAGMPHHVAVIGGHHAALLERLARALNIQTI